ncbi:Spo0E like sporulation regulatory protein [Seinonella peptonophila]|uniref:Spo0E like sporulation regulatory protein n=1 Tax=Seinonella peptonophila TaxID=112248 RepID=A0A1M4WJQ6_9BACL|nr:aspartyl-phosphate phosphatase Spo0E family protein [Seinonella peptonophila]SHE81390.1 Spo0E like sporulation regulatory protein [Seinonella peptonophila]
MQSRKLEEKIEVLRRQMVQYAMSVGFSHPQVYRLSVYLDQLHNRWHRIQHINE